MVESGKVLIEKVDTLINVADYLMKLVPIDNFSSGFNHLLGAS